MKYNNIDLSEAPTPAYVLCTFTDGVEFGYFDGKTFSFDDYEKHEPSNLLELRIFNEEREFRAIYSQSRKDYIYTNIHDGGNYTIIHGVRFLHSSTSLSDEQNDIKSDEIWMIDEDMHLFGESYIGCQNGITTFQDRGATKNFYLSLPNEPLSIRVRNYLTYDENDMVVLENYRLVGIYAGIDNKKEVLSCQ